MAHSLTWLPDALKIAGLKVSLVDGWQDRGRGDVGRIFGVICHHTAGSRNGNMPSLRTLVNGREGLPAPSRNSASAATARSTLLPPDGLTTPEEASGEAWSTATQIS